MELPLVATCKQRSPLRNVPNALKFPCATLKFKEKTIRGSAADRDRLENAHTCCKANEIPGLGCVRGYLLEFGVHMPHIPVEAMTLLFRLYQIRLVLLLREIQWNSLGRRPEGVEQIFVLVQPGLRYDF